MQTLEEKIKTEAPAITKLSFWMGMWVFIVVFLYTDLRTGAASGLLAFGVSMIVFTLLAAKRLRKENKTKKEAV